MVTKLRLRGDQMPVQVPEREQGRRLLFPVEAVRQLGARPDRPGNAAGVLRRSESAERIPALRPGDIVREVERHLDLAQQKLDRVKEEVAGAIQRESGGLSDRPSAA